MLPESLQEEETSAAYLFHFVCWLLWTLYCHFHISRPCMFSIQRRSLENYPCILVSSNASTLDCSVWTQTSSFCSMWVECDALLEFWCVKEAKLQRPTCGYNFIFNKIRLTFWGNQYVIQTARCCELDTCLKRFHACLLLLCCSSFS